MLFSAPHKRSACSNFERHIRIYTQIHANIRMYVCRFVSRLDRVQLLADSSHFPPRKDNFTGRVILARGRLSVKSTVRVKHKIDLSGNAPGGVHHRESSVRSRPRKSIAGECSRRSRSPGVFRTESTERVHRRECSGRSWPRELISGSIPGEVWISGSIPGEVDGESRSLEDSFDFPQDGLFQPDSPVWYGSLQFDGESRSKESLVPFCGRSTNSPGESISGSFQGRSRQRQSISGQFFRFSSGRTVSTGESCSVQFLGIRRRESISRIIASILRTEHKFTGRSISGSFPGAVDEDSRSPDNYFDFPQDWPFRRESLVGYGFLEFDGESRSQQ